jgi:hypothetical protein
MRLIDIIIFSDFMQVLYIKRRYPIKNEYFLMHILFTTIYLFQEHKLNHENYSKKEINMGNFLQTTDHYVHIYAKFGGLTCYEFL